MEATKQKKARKSPTAVLAEFETAHAVVHAAEKVRDAGYSRWDTHTPFPIHGMDKAMGLKDSRLGWIVIAFALTGLGSAFTMMHWMNGVDYVTIVGDKPAGALFSGPGMPGTLPSMVPIMFELTVLFSAFGAVLGMFHLNGLPRHNHTLFESERFKAASDDKFFISIEAEDPKFDVTAARALLEGAHASHVEVIEEEL
ncbi:MAG: DUF3341 domain-containing protein [Polyangiaceae bacterium]